MINDMLELSKMLKSIVKVSIKESELKYLTDADINELRCLNSEMLENLEKIKTSLSEIHKNIRCAQKMDTEYRKELFSNFKYHVSILRQAEIVNNFNKKLLGKDAYKFIYPMSEYENSFWLLYPNYDDCWKYVYPKDSEFYVHKFVGDDFDPLFDFKFYYDIEAAISDVSNLDCFIDYLVEHPNLANVKSILIY